MFSDGLVDLVEKGVITNARKKVHQGKIVGGFCLGTRRLYDFIDNNPSLGRCHIVALNVWKFQPISMSLNLCLKLLKRMVRIVQTASQARFWQDAFHFQNDFFPHVRIWYIP